MPDGKRHGEATLLLGFLTMPLYAVDVRFVGTTLGAWTGLLVDPDLDLTRWTEAERRLWRFSRPLGWLWRLYWFPYAKHNRHRGVSHTIIGTAVRAALVGWPLPLLGVPWDWVGLWFVGLALADGVHALMDLMEGRCKKSYR